MHNRWNNIGIDRHSHSCTRFIVGTIKYNKHCATKLSFPYMLIIDYLDATFILISSGLMRSNTMIQTLFMHINFHLLLKMQKEK